MRPFTPERDVYDSHALLDSLFSSLSYRHRCRRIKAAKSRPILRLPHLSTSLPKFKYPNQAGKTALQFRSPSHHRATNPRNPPTTYSNYRKPAAPPSRRGTR